MADLRNLRAPPPWNIEQTAYEDWRFQVELWEKCTTVDKKEKGFVLFSSIPHKDTTGAHERLRLACKNKEITLESDDAVKQILKVLDKVYKKDDLSLTFETWSTFIRLRRKDTDNMVQYITNYDRKVSELKRDGIELPETVLASQLLESVCLDKKERQLVLTAVDYSQKETMYEQMRMALIKFQGEDITTSKGNNVTFKVKEELVNTTDNEEAYYTRRNSDYGNRYGNFGNDRGNTAQRGRTNWSRGRRSRGRGYVSKNTRGRTRSLNPKDADGNLLRCNVCDSIYHFVKHCPDARQNFNEVSEDDEDCYLSMDDHQALICETVNAAVLDSACTKTVTGRAWRDTYLESLSERERSQVKTLPGGTVFSFGGERKKESFEKLILPCTIAGKKVMIQTDVVDSDIPLLLRKPDMKRFGLQINMENNTAKISDKIVDLGPGQTY